MDQFSLISHLQKETKIKDTPMFKDLSDMNVPDQVVSDYSNSLHNFKLKRGDIETQKRILDISQYMQYSA